MSSKNISILGIRGIPAHHGGFETFAEKLALYLVNNKWDVTVFCQEDIGNHIDYIKSEILNSNQDQRMIEIKNWLNN